MRSRSIIASIAAGLIAWTASERPVVMPQATPTFVEQAENDTPSKTEAKPQGRVDCRNAADRAVEDSGGQLLSVRLSGGQCVITILVPGQGDNARPRKMTIQVAR